MFVLLINVRMFIQLQKQFGAIQVSQNTILKKPPSAICSGKKVEYIVCTYCIYNNFTFGKLKQNKHIQYIVSIFDTIHITSGSELA